MEHRLIVSPMSKHSVLISSESLHCNVKLCTIIVAQNMAKYDVYYLR
jgi:hypothetical protein